MEDKKNKPVNPTKQHSMKCPALYGKDCKCDGYHTFDELYDHRIALFIALVNSVPENVERVWKSKKHFNGTEWKGWFIAGMEIKGQQISYHLPIDKWYQLHVQALDKAPVWDGHTSDDVIKRLYKYFS